MYHKQSYISKPLPKSFNSLSKIVDVDHPVINAILNDALGKSSLAGITLKSTFLFPLERLSPLVFSVILGNTFG